MSRKTSPRPAATHYGQAGDITCGSELTCYGPASLLTSWDRAQVTCGRCKRTQRWKTMRTS